MDRHTHTIAPEVFRQRLLIEGYFERDISRAVVEDFLLELAAHLELRTYSEPVIFAPDGLGKPENAGFDAFVPLVDSGISVYVWAAQKFFSVLIFTCKAFDEEAAIDFTTQFLRARAGVHHHRF